MTVAVLYDVPFCSTDSGDYTLYHSLNILLTKTTAVQNEATLSYHNVRGLYVLAVVFVGNIVKLLTPGQYLKFVFKNAIVWKTYNMYVGADC